MQEDFIKIDPHTHSSGVSICSGVTVEEIIDDKIANGYQGIVLTNHCQKHYYPESEHSAYIERVIAEYKKAKAYGEKKKFLVLLGLEVSIFEPAYNDWLLYGVSEEILRKSPCLYSLTQRELFEFCQNNGVVLVQAHPFRNSGWGEREFMHGVEVNCSGGDIDKAEMVIARAKENGFLVTAGSDYHRTKSNRGGMFVPSWVKTSEDFGKYLIECKQTQVFAEEKRWVIANPKGNNA